jgi:hypothetical protein
VSRAQARPNGLKMSTMRSTLMLMAWKLLEGDQIVGTGVIACD